MWDRDRRRFRHLFDFSLKRYSGSAEDRTAIDFELGRRKRVAIHYSRRGLLRTCQLCRVDRTPLHFLSRSVRDCVAGASIDFIFHVAARGPLLTLRPPLTPRARPAKKQKQPDLRVRNVYGIRLAGDHCVFWRCRWILPFAQRVPTAYFVRGSFRAEGGKRHGCKLI